ncbi:MAG: transporter substrate-binding domain-containing protein [Lachnospiraceae bacterium]|nr:transporter substrate-binding domain-containing protein [Lachnospiraceae bacterium]
MKRRVVSVLLCLTVAVALAACGGKEKEEKGSKEKDDKVIRIGCEATTPGWIQTDEDGKLSGYDYDVWTEIGRRTGYEIEYKVMEWDGMWTMLNDERLDAIGEQISSNDEREEKYYLSEPYAYNVYSLLSRADNENLQTMDDLKDGMTISCETNTSDELIVEAIEKEYGIKLEPTYFDGMSVQEVALGRCDLWPRARTSCLTTLEEVDNLKILGDTNVLETNVYPFSKTERGKELCDMVSETLKEMHEDGTLTKLSEKWFDTDISVKPEGAKAL